MFLLLLSLCDLEPVVDPVAYAVNYNGNGNLSGTVPVESARYELGELFTVPGNTGGLANGSYLFV